MPTHTNTAHTLFGRSSLWITPYPVYFKLPRNFDFYLPKINEIKDESELSLILWSRGCHQGGMEERDNRLVLFADTMFS